MHRPLSVISILVVAATAASAATPLLPSESPVVIQRFVDVLRNNMALGSYPDGTPMQAEPSAERAQPIMSAALAQRIFDRGFVSGVFEACGGAWQEQSFMPMVAELKARRDLSPKQQGFAVMLHNAAKEQATGRITEEDCTPALKSSALATLAVQKKAKLPK